MDSNTLIKLLEAKGWKKASVRGDHFTYKHPKNPLLITVTHPVKDVSIGVLNRALKISGLK